MSSAYVSSPFRRPVRDGWRGSLQPPLAAAGAGPIRAQIHPEPGSSAEVGMVCAWQRRNRGDPTAHPCFSRAPRSR